MGADRDPASGCSRRHRTATRILLALGVLWVSAGGFASPLGLDALSTWPWNQGWFMFSAESGLGVPPRSRRGLRGRRAPGNDRSQPLVPRPRDRPRREAPGDPARSRDHGGALGVRLRPREPRGPSGEAALADLGGGAGLATGTRPAPPRRGRSSPPPPRASCVDRRPPLRGGYPVKRLLSPWISSLRRFEEDFLHRPIPVEPLCLYRVGVGILLFLEAATWLPHTRELFSSDGFHLPLWPLVHPSPALAAAACVDPDRRLALPLSGALHPLGQRLRPGLLDAPLRAGSDRLQGDPLHRDRGARAPPLHPLGRRVVSRRMARPGRTEQWATCAPDLRARAPADPARVCPGVLLLRCHQDDEPGVGERGRVLPGLRVALGHAARDLGVRLAPAARRPGRGPLDHPLRDPGALPPLSPILPPLRPRGRDRLPPGDPERALHRIAGGALPPRPRDPLPGSRGREERGPALQQPPRDHQRRRSDHQAAQEGLSSTLDVQSRSAAQGHPTHQGKEGQ